jgi:hypothetical protein
VTKEELMDEPQRPRTEPIPLVLTKVDNEGLTDEQIARIFSELGIEPEPGDDGSESPDG